VSYQNNLLDLLLTVASQAIDDPDLVKDWALLFPLLVATAAVYRKALVQQDDRQSRWYAGFRDVEEDSLRMPRIVLTSSAVLQ